MKKLCTQIVIVGLMSSCGDGGSAIDAVSSITNTTPSCQEPSAPEQAAPAAPEAASSKSSKAVKLTMDGCIDPELSSYAKGKQVTLCNGELAYGTYEPETLVPENCNRNGQTGCMANGKYASNDITNLTAGNIKKGVTVAGVYGIYEEPTYQLCNGNGQTGCVSTPSHPSNNIVGLTPSNLRTGVTVADVVGAFNPSVESHTDCTARGQTGCIATASFPTIDSASSALLVSGNIRSGVTIAGVTGNYPSASSPLAGSSAVADLDNATFTAKVKSSASFEYFDSTGARHTNQGSDYIQEQYIRSGVTIFGISGALLNPVTDEYDVRLGVTINGVAGKFRADCRRNDGTAPANEQCTAGSVIAFNGSGCTANSGGCAWHRTTGKKWFRLFDANMSNAPTQTWDQMKTACETSTIDGGGWRMPTFSELQAIIHSIKYGSTSGGLTLGASDLGYWAGPTRTTVDSYGSATSYNAHSATTGYRGLCVKNP